jgi:hypothetical protein
VALRARFARANASHERANESRLVRPPQRCAASIGQIPPRLSVYAPAMIGRVLIPSSIASLVARGRHWIALSNWLIGSRRLGIAHGR